MHVDLVGPHGGLQRRMVAFGLVGIEHCVIAHGLVEAILAAKIAADHQRIAGFGMGPCQHPAAGLAKLAGAEMMVQTFDAVGFGQWFRYVTGAIEVGSAIALWIPGLQAYAAGLLVCTMIGALIAHAMVLGLAGGVPALVLGALAAMTLRAYRAQLSR